MQESFRCFVEAEQSVPLHVEQLTAAGVRQLGWRAWQVCGSIQAQHIVQPLLHRVSRRIPAKQPGDIINTHREKGVRNGRLRRPVPQPATTPQQWANMPSLQGQVLHKTHDLRGDDQPHSVELISIIHLVAERTGHQVSTRVELCAKRVKSIIINQHSH